jgi:protein-disulfide isomerase
MSCSSLKGVAMNQNQVPRSLFVPASMQDHIQGVLNAAVILVMYGDYQCLISADVNRVIKVIRRQLTMAHGENHLCFIFRHFPQIQIHPQAQHAAEAAEAAATQGQFWQMHNILFAHQQELGNGYLVEYANHLKLDIPHFLQDISKQVHIDRIEEDIASGLQSGVTSTPALFINGSRYSGHWNMAQLMTAINAASHS